MLAAAKAVAAVCLDLWTDRTLASRVQEEFAGSPHRQTA
jgi:hypothetical protein